MNSRKINNYNIIDNYYISTLQLLNTSVHEFLKDQRFPEKCNILTVDALRGLILV